MTLWRLAIVFTILSVLGFGGGKAIIPQMHRDVVDQQHWTTAAQFARYFAVARLAPGSTASVSALVGFSAAGLAGAAVAAFAMFLPSSLICFGLGKVWHRFDDHAWRRVGARALAPVVIGLSWGGVSAIAHGALLGPPTVAVAVVTTVLMLFTRLPIVALIGGCALAGMVFLR